MEHEVRNYAWPDTIQQVKSPQSTAIVTVNYNTYQLIAQLIWSIYHSLKRGGFAKLVVVDNNSSDGSQQLLRHLARENVIEYIENKENLYHGPALNQAIDTLSKQQIANQVPNIHTIWVLDSDCVVVRPDTLKDAITVMNKNQAVLVGQPVLDKWNRGTFGLHSLLVDPERIWRDPIKPFEEHGQPSHHLQESARENGLKTAAFNFTAENYVIHLGRSTLAEIAKRQESGNRYFAWAKKHSTPHFAAEENAKERYEAFRKEFLHAIPNFEVDTIVNAIMYENR